MSAAEKIEILEFGARVCHYRALLKLSQQGLADTAGIEEKQVYLIEKGLSDIRITTVIAIVYALNQHPNALIPFRQEESADVFPYLVQGPAQFERTAVLAFFGRQVKALRLYRRLSQRQLAAIAGIQAKQVYLVERASTDVYYSTAVALIWALNAQPDWVIPFLHD